MELGGCRWNTPCQLTAVPAASPAGAGGPGAGRAGRCPARRGGGGVLSPSAVGVAAPRVAELPHLSHPRQRGPRCGGRSVANKHVKSGLGHSVTCSRVCGGGLAPPSPTACLLCPGGSCSNRGGALPRQPGRELSPPPWGGVWATGPGKGSPSVAQDTPRGGVACPWFRPRCCLSSRQTSRRASQYSARLRLGSGSRAVW